MSSLVERCLSAGAQELSQRELLALLVGPKGAKPLVQHSAAKLTRLLGDDVAHLSPLQRARFEAAFELGRRAAAPEEEKPQMRGPRDVWRYYGPKLEHLTVEEFHVAVLDSQHRLEHDVLVSRGILNSSLVHPREVFAAAISRRAASVCLVHNHPSGDPNPSQDDRSITSQLVAAGRLLDIPVQDHVVIGRGRYVSFAEAGLL